MCNGRPVMVHTHYYCIKGWWWQRQRRHMIMGGIVRVVQVDVVPTLVVVIYSFDGFGYRLM